MKEVGSETQGGRKGTRTHFCSTSPQKIPSIERRLKAMELRRQGLNYTEIGKELGISRSRAQQLIAEEFRRLRALETEAATDLLKIANDRLERLIQTYYGPAIAGDQKAADMVLRLIQRQSALFGLDAPKKREDKLEVSSNDPETLKARARMMGLEEETTSERRPAETQGGGDDARFQAGQAAGGADVQAPGDPRPE